MLCLRRPGTNRKALVLGLHTAHTGRGHTSGIRCGRRGNVEEGLGMEKVKRGPPPARGKVKSCAGFPRAMEEGIKTMVFTDGPADKKHMHAGCGMAVVDPIPGVCIVEHADQASGAAQTSSEAEFSTVEAVSASMVAARGAGNLGEVAVVFVRTCRWCAHGHGLNGWQPQAACVWLRMVA